MDSICSKLDSDGLKVCIIRLKISLDELIGSPLLKWSDKYQCVNKRCGNKSKC